MTNEELKEFLKPKNLPKITKLEWDGLQVPEFPFNLMQTVKTNTALIWDNLEFYPSYNRFTVTGVWNPIEDFDESDIIFFGDDWNIKEIIIGFDKNKDRFFAVGFLNE